MIATPELEDPNFRHTLTLLVEHGEEAVVGLTLNRPSQTLVAEAWASSEEAVGPCRIEGPVHVGGPCPGPLMILHRRPELGDRQVLGGLWYTAEPERVIRLVGEGVAPSIVCAGYAGWDPAQLEGELELGSWLLARPGAEEVFAAAADESAWLHWLGRVEPALALLAARPHLVPDDPTVN